MRSFPKLKPCPFCGGDAYLENTVTEAVVRCFDCSASVSKVHIDPSIDTGITAAPQAWNTRTTDQAKDEEIARLRSALDRIATVDMGGGFLGAEACRKVAKQALGDAS